MSGEPYTPGFTPLMKDPSVIAEFERIAAYWAGLLPGATPSGSSPSGPEAGLNTQQIIANNSALPAGRAEAGLNNFLHDTIPSAPTTPQITYKSGAGFRLYKSTTQAAVNGETALTWDVERIDTDNFFPGSGSTVTITIPGTYIICCRITTTSGADPENVLVSLKVNGVEVARTREHVVWIGQFVGGETLVAYVTLFGNDPWVISAASTTGFEAYQLPASPGTIIPGTGGVGGTGTPQAASASDFIPGFTSRNWWGGRANGQDTTYNTIGTGINNATADGTPNVNNQASSTFTKYTSGAGIAQKCGVRDVSNVGVQTRHGPTFLAKILTGGVITAIRIWIGLTETTPTNADEIAGAHYVMFRYSTVAGDGGWVGVVRNGSTALQSVTGTVAAIAASTEYLLKIRLASDGLTAYFSVNGGAEVSIATNLPPVTINLGWAITLLTTEAVAKDLNVSRHFCIYGI